MDKTVFKAFVRDILGLEVEVGKIETEKNNARGPARNSSGGASRIYRSNTV